MAEKGSVSGWIEQLKAQDTDAARRIWDRYATRVLQMAAKKLGKSAGTVEDESDVVIDVFDALCRGLARGQFPKVENRMDLWGLLIRMTERRASDVMRRENRKRRGGEYLVEYISRSGAEQIRDCSPGPQETALLAESLQKLLEALNDEVLRAIAVLKLQGHQNSEVAIALKRPLRTVERKMELIRMIWAGYLDRVEDAE